MKRLLTYLLLAAMALALCLLTRQCGMQKQTDLSIKHAGEALKKAVVIFQPDTTSDIRFGHPTNTPKP